MSNFIPNEMVTTDDRDPPWINNKIKSFIKNMDILKICVKPNNSISILNKFGMLFENISKFLGKSVILNFLENLQLVKSITNVIGSY